MRIEQIHASIEAARAERTRYLVEALHRGLTHVARAVQRGFASTGAGRPTPSTTGEKRAPRWPIGAAGSGPNR